MGTFRGSVVGSLAFLGHRYPLVRGQGWLAGRWLPAPRLDGAAMEVRLSSGPRVMVFPNELIGRAVFYFGDLDPRITWVLRQTLRLGDTVIDVGANCGVVSLVAADLVGTQGKVHAFEPQPGVAELLARSARLNSYSQLDVHEVGLSEADAELELHVPIGHLGGASLNRVDGPGTSLAVKVRHASTVLSELDPRPVRLLKVDIEGHEAEFLRGARDFLRAHPPEVILFESNDALYETGVHVPFWQREAVQILSDLEYDMVRISQRAGAVGPRLVKVKAGDDRGLDFVAIHRSRYPEMARLLAVS